MHSLRLAARSLLRVPVFSLAIVASLGISIAAITTVVSVADAVIFRALPFHDADRLVWIASVRPQRSDAPFSLPEFMDYAQRTRTVDIAAYTSWNAAMGTPTVARRLQGMRMSANSFDVLGVSPPAGRLLRPADDRPDAPRVVVLSYAFWVSEFAADRAVAGRSIRLNDQQHEIVGVLPRHFPLPLRNVDVVIPLTPALDPRRHIRSSTNFLRIFGRVRMPGSIQLARRELAAIADELRAQFPSEYASKLGVAVTPMQEFLVGDTRQTFVLMMGAAALLLGIALANVLNLLLIRGVAKRGEMALRRALGGSGRQLAYGAAGEAALLAVVGAAVGVLLSTWLVSLIASSSIVVPRIDEARVSGRTLIFVIAIAVLATLVFSIMQLMSALRASPRQAMAAIGRGMQGSRGETRLRAAFLVAQLGFAVLLTIVTATMARSLARIQAVELGFRQDSVFVARLALPPHKYRSVADLSRFAQELEQALHGSPGVVAAGGISIAPLSGNLSIIPFTIPGRSPATERERLEANLRAITPGYLTAIGARLRTGRDFLSGDNELAARAAIVSRALAERYFPSGEALGKELLADDNNEGPRPVTIVGVVENMRHVRIDGPAPFDIYIPMAQVHRDGLGLVAGSQFWAARVTAGNDYSRTFVRTLASIDRDVALARVQPMQAYIDDNLSSRRFSVLALLGFALVALVLAIIGVYGLVAYSVEQRRREIGLRLALGATRVDVIRSFIQPAVALAMLGAAFGLAGAIVTRQAVAGLLFGVTPTEPVILAVVALALIVASALAAAIPARRAAALDPSLALAAD